MESPQYVVFRGLACFLPSKPVLLSFLQAGACISSLFLFMADLYSTVEVNSNQFIPSPADGHFDYSQVLATMNEAALSICV